MHLRLVLALGLLAGLLGPTTTRELAAFGAGAAPAGHDFGPGLRCGFTRHYLPLVLDGGELVMPREAGSRLLTHEIVHILETMGRVAGKRQIGLVYPDTLQDDFSTYGGDTLAQNASAALKWLQIFRMENSENAEWANDTGASMEFSPMEVKQGVTALKAVSSTGATFTIINRYTYPTAKDYSAEGRFGSGDLIRLDVYTSIVPANFLQIRFRSAIQDATASFAVGGLAVGWNHLAMKRSAITDNGIDWTAVIQIELQWQDNDTQGTVYWDNFQIVKAHPYDPDIPSAVGNAWDFNDSDGSATHWTVLQDMPGHAYALAQLKTHATEQYSAICLGDYTVRDHLSAAVLLREDGKAGLLFLAVDGENGYALVLDTSADTLTLYDRSAGVDTSLGSVAYVAAPNVVYYLGLRRIPGDGDENTIQAYLSATAGPLFVASNLKLSVTDDVHGGRAAGLISYGKNARYADFRGGSPSYTLTSEWAAVARVAEYGAASLFDQILTDDNGDVLSDDNGDVLTEDGP